MAVSGAPYPVTLDLDAPLEVARWRPLVHWLLGIPQFIVSSVLNQIFQLLSLVSFFTILFTGRIPRELFDFMTMTLRYQWRVGSYAFFMRESYPPFEFGSKSEDPGTDPAALAIEYPESLSRVLIFFKTWLLAIPHYVVLFFLYIGGFFVMVVAFFAVLFTGSWPEGLRQYMIGVGRWTLRVQAYAGLMRDEYPPFSLQ